MSGPEEAPEPGKQLPPDPAAEYGHVPEYEGPRGHAEWLKEVQDLEAIRDAYMLVMPDPEARRLDPKYQNLLGRLGVAQEELQAHASAQFRRELDESG